MPAKHIVTLFFCLSYGIMMAQMPVMKSSIHGSAVITNLEQGSVFPVYDSLYPSPACISYEDGQLMICPPDSITGDPPAVVLGYNVYVDDDFDGFQTVSYPLDTVYYTFTELPFPGSRVICVKAVYDGWISDPVCDSVFLRYGHSIPFYEDWESLSFDTNQWNADPHWSISDTAGHPDASALFQGGNSLNNYYEVLEAWPVMADSIDIGNIWLAFDLNLSTINNTGAEKLQVEIWDWDQLPNQWLTVHTFSNSNNIHWSHKRFKINIVRGDITKIRFIAEGINSNDIESWKIDNIRIYRSCLESMDLQAEINGDDVLLEWFGPTCGNHNPWYHWDDGVNFTSIGTGSAAEFDVAARWLPLNLTHLEGAAVHQIAFFPAEATATYTLKIWEGSTPNLVYEQLVIDPVIGDWNFVLLDSIHYIDISNELWVGYHVNTSTAYPAGCDFGPAIDGHGNMMFYEGEWQTLLQINPELDFNWNLQFSPMPPSHLNCLQRIYRKTANLEYVLLDEIPWNYEYIDTTANLSVSNCYKMTNYYIKEWDTCESAYSNEACIQPVGLTHMIEEVRLQVYPNPFNRETTFRYWLINSEFVSLVIYDQFGREVGSLVSQKQQMGEHTITWDASGKPAGIYYYSLIAGEERNTGKLVILR